MESEQHVPRLLTLAWGVAVAPQRGPKRELTHERIVEAAMDIADAEGLQAVTMQRVAKSFGFTTMAMYRYVASKDDLYRLMADAVTADQQWALDDNDWKAGLTEWVRQLDEAYRRHPWVLDIPVSQESMLMPGNIRVADAGMRAMRSLKATPSEKTAIIMTSSALVRGLAAVLRGMNSEQDQINESTKELICSMVVDAHLIDIEPLLRDGVYFAEPPREPAGTEQPDDTQIAWQLVAEGIEHSFGTREAEPPRTPPDRTPDQIVGDAEAELQRAVALRKAAQRRVGQLEKAEARARAARDKAKTAAKEAAKSAGA
ncbi:TetR/AcrR family transcriptional regulator [Propionimicrobium sp. PCR01-08-3]|uniref:TetR/AcrR family transcriptional regulator n=1 Tax=Propionimicrobium sp. PCR01-08-3 TaxID=3052086 RepID=UPI00255C3621|nr:TetR/AcrR family transcriptional regulator [Propionimicrobium sp. PCR01-08-3]WIY83454.1 TetR/AcrR family transcriptional regulator [Propionimicrobium sp. PCR01-08-3]